MLTLLHFYDLVHRCDLETQPDTHTAAAVAAAGPSVNNAPGMISMTTAEDIQLIEHQGLCGCQQREANMPPSPKSLDEAKNPSSCLKHSGNQKDKALQEFDRGIFHLLKNNQNSRHRTMATARGLTEGEGEEVEKISDTVSVFPRHWKNLNYCLTLNMVGELKWTLKPQSKYDWSWRTPVEQPREPDCYLNSSAM